MGGTPVRRTGTARRGGSGVARSRAAPGVNGPCAGLAVGLAAAVRGIGVPLGLAALGFLLPLLQLFLLLLFLGAIALGALLVVVRLESHDILPGQPIEDRKSERGTRRRKIGRASGRERVWQYG